MFERKSKPFYLAISSVLFPLGSIVLIHLMVFFMWRLVKGDPFTGLIFLPIIPVFPLLVCIGGILGIWRGKRALRSLTDELPGLRKRVAMLARTGIVLGYGEFLYFALLWYLLD